MGLDDRAQSQAERMSLHEQEMEMLEQQQARTISCPMGTCSGPADHSHDAPGHHGPEPHHGKRARPAGHTLAAPSTRSSATCAAAPTSTILNLRRWSRWLNLPLTGAACMSLGSCACPRRDAGASSGMTSSFLG
ncbi:hypothetical protein PIB30_092590, partial [Stylosanthes scabra]|nr:hypothetical protein [Stylosanthes scabra]